MAKTPQRFLINGYGSSQPTLIVTAGDGPCTIVNNDELNTVYFDNNIGVNPTRSTTVFLPPQASTSVDGKSDVYAICSAGDTADFLVFPGIVPWQNPVGVQIALNALGLAKESTQLLVESNTGNTATNVDTVNTTLGTPAQTADIDTVNTTLGSPAQHNDVVTTGPANTADNIASTGVPLLSNANNLINLSNTVIAAGGSNSQGPVDINQIGYELFISIESAATSNSPYFQMILTWTDSASNRVVSTEEWDLMGGNAAFQQYCGTGPTKGDRLSISFNNSDAANSVTFVFSFTLNSRVYVRDDIRQITTHTPPGFTNSNIDVPANILGAMSPSVPTGSGGLTRLLGLFAGLANISIANGAQPISITITCIANPTAGLGPSTEDLIYSTNVAANANANASINLPRGICSVFILNTGSAAVSPTIGVNIAEQVA